MTDEAKETALELLRPCMHEKTHIIRRPDGTEVTLVDQRIVRVELHGIARFACWWFVILSGLALLVAILRT